MRTPARGPWPGAGAVESPGEAVGGARMQDRFRHDGALAYNLLGDPATRVPWPGKLDVKAGESVKAGEGVAVSGEAAAADGAPVVVTLECPRLTPREPLEEIVRKDPDGDALRRNWARMNEPVLARAEGVVRGGAFRVVLTVPEGVSRGEYVVKVWLSDGVTDALGSRRVKVSAP